MGIGDELLAAGEAARLYRRDGLPVCIIGRKGPRWHPIWNGNPYLVPEPAGAATLLNGPGNRNYIDKDRSNRQRWAFRPDYRAERATIVLTPDEREAACRFPAGAVVLEPHVKAGASPNKDWGWSRWQRLANILSSLPGFPPLVQLGPAGTRVLRGVRLFPTGDFRAACAALDRAALAILPEGGLHHAAAALGVPAIVIFGGYIRPETTGYAGHVNLFTGNANTIGWRVHHSGCRWALDAIKAEDIASHAVDIIEAGHRAA